MITTRSKYLKIGIIMLFTAACQQKKASENTVNFKSFYDKYQVNGAFALYDSRNEKYIYYNKSQFNEAYTPASTFKICNALIGLETGVIKDENFVIPWDSVNRNPVWDKDHDLKTAFKNSTVWYFQELAKKVGEEKMKYWVEKAYYGNATITGGIDKFWLSGDLRISAAQQIDFLKRLRNNQLPFSQRSMDIVKNIMIEKDSMQVIIRGKTGWGGQANIDIGWFVGYIETKDNVYYFSNCVQIESVLLNDVQRAILFDHSRTAIVYQIVDSLNLLP